MLPARSVTLHAHRLPIVHPSSHKCVSTSLRYWHALTTSLLSFFGTFSAETVSFGRMVASTPPKTTHFIILKLFPCITEKLLLFPPQQTVIEYLGQLRERTAVQSPVA